LYVVVPTLVNVTVKVFPVAHGSGEGGQMKLSFSSHVWLPPGLAVTLCLTAPSLWVHVTVVPLVISMRLGTNAFP
jgi:hypothetical protein